MNLPGTLLRILGGLLLIGSIKGAPAQVPEPSVETLELEQNSLGDVSLEYGATQEAKNDSLDLQQELLEKKKKMDAKSLRQYELDELDSFYDPKVNYTEFFGRVTDRDQREQVIKIKTETKNVRFLKVGDSVRFTVNQHEKEDPCLGNVRGIEDDYLILFVKSIRVCSPDEASFRRGTQLNLKSEVLMKRVVQASEYRRVLLKSRQDFLKQLSHINHFIWSFDQQRIKLASDYDRRVMDIQKEKQEAMEQLLGRKEEQIVIQKELMQKIQEIEASMDFYRLDRQEYLVDRWKSDHNLGLPVSERPQPLKVLNDPAAKTGNSFFSN